MKIKIPEVGLASFDDYHFMNYITPKVTSLKQPFKELGGSAVDMVCKIIENGQPDTNQIIHGTQIIPRESCGES